MKAVIGKISGFRRIGIRILSEPDRDPGVIRIWKLPVALRSIHPFKTHHIFRGKA